MFKVGDLIKGKKNQKHEYVITDERMTLGIVESVKEDNGKQLMYVKIKKCYYTEYNGDGFWVYNDTSDFELVGEDWYET